MRLCEASVAGAGNLYADSVSTRPILTVGWDRVRRIAPTLDDGAAYPEKTVLQNLNAALLLWRGRMWLEGELPFPRPQASPTLGSGNACRGLPEPISPLHCQTGATSFSVFSQRW